MIEERGRVVALEPGKAWIETVRQSACSSCSARKGCGHSVLEKVYDGRRSRVLALNDLDLAIGDEAVVAISEDALMKGSVVLYFVPLVTMLLGMWGVGSLAESSVRGGGSYSDLYYLLGAVIGLTIGLGVNRLFALRNGSNPMYQPKVIQRIGSRENVPRVFLDDNGPACSDRKTD